MPLALTVAVLTYLLLRRAFDTGIRGRWPHLTVEYEKPVPVAMMITNPYVAHALFANRREPAPLDDEPTLLD